METEMNMLPCYRRWSFLLGVLSFLKVFPAVAQSNDSLPQGTISFFNLKQCPDGWEPLLMADGRLVVPLVEGATNGASTGQPLKSGQDPVHSHGLDYSFSLNRIEKKAPKNKDSPWPTPVQVGKADAHGDSSPKTTGLPYVQLLFCTKKTTPHPSAAPPPSGTLIFYGFEACPHGWSKNRLTEGRLLVGTDKEAREFGGRALKPLEQRLHEHPFTARILLPSFRFVSSPGLFNSKYAFGGSGEYKSSGTSRPDVSRLPYIQLLQCVKA
jgi:hypothetical protein